MKKYISLLLVAVLLISCFGAFALAEKNIVGFSDVTPDKWYYQNVLELVGRGAVKGYPDKTFRPENTIATSEFVKLATTLYTEVDTKGTNKWYKPYISKAEQLGIVPDGMFTENDYTLPIPREKLAVIMVLCSEKMQNEKRIQDENLLAEVKKSINDFDSITEEYQQYVLQAIAKGLMNGYTDGTFKPLQSSKRSECCTLCIRLVDETKRIKLNFGKTDEQRNKSHTGSSATTGNTSNTPPFTPETSVDTGETVPPQEPEIDTDLLLAKQTLENTVYPDIQKVGDTTMNDIVSEYVKEIADNTVTNVEITKKLVKIALQEAIDGTKTDISGANGYFNFKFELEKGTEKVTTSALTVNILAREWQEETGFYRTGTVLPADTDYLLYSHIPEDVTGTMSYGASFTNLMYNYEEKTDSGEYVIPVAMKNKNTGKWVKVTGVDERATSLFGDEVTSIAIPNTVTDISLYSVSEKEHIEELYIPSSVTTLDDTSLPFVQNIVVAKSNTKYDSRENCNAIIDTEEKEIIAFCTGSDIPNGVEKIPYNLISMKFIFGNGTINIGDSFDPKHFVLPISYENDGSIALENAIEAIYSYDLIINDLQSEGADMGNCEFTSIVINSDNPYVRTGENSQTVIRKDNGKLLFANGTLEYTDNISGIYPFAFAFQTLETLPFIDKLEKIDFMAFAMANIENIVVPSNINEIETSAFASSNARSLTIESSERSIKLNNRALIAMRNVETLTIKRHLVPLDTDEVACQFAPITNVYYDFSSDELIAGLGEPILYMEPSNDLMTSFISPSDYTHTTYHCSDKCFKVTDDSFSTLYDITCAEHSH